MASEVQDSGQIMRWTTVQKDSGGGEPNEGPLLIAMQPGSDIPQVGVQEVVVMTDSVPASADIGGSEMVTGVGVVEEVVDANIIEIRPQIKSETPVREGRRASKKHKPKLSPSPPAPVINLKPGKVLKKTPKLKIKQEEEEPETFSSKRKYGLGRGGKSLVRYQRPVSPVPEPESSSGNEQEDIPMLHIGDHDVDDFLNETKSAKKREFAHRLQWRNRDMLDAMKAVDEKNMTIRGAAKKYNVPYSTLKDRVHGRVRHGTKPGVKTVLSPEEEEELVRYIRDMEAAGFLMKHVDVRERAGELLRLNHGHNSPYKESSPGHNWLAGFLKRHQGLEFRRHVQRNLPPSVTKQKQMLKRFFEVAGQGYKRIRLHNRADRIYTVTQVQVNVNGIATILACSSADGSSLPPFVIFRGERLKLTSARQAFPEAFFACSWDGMVNEDTFLWWFRDHFLKKIPQTGNRPSVLYLSRPLSDVTLQLSQLAKEERIHLVCMPVGIHHLLQPLDDEMMTHVEEALKKKVRKWEDENQGTLFSHRVLAQCLHKVWRKCLTADQIVKNFNQNGLYPLNPSSINTERIITAAQNYKEPYTVNSVDMMASPMLPLSGLSLLSALSSQEYASLEQFVHSSNGRSYEQETESTQSPVKQERVTTSKQPEKPPSKSSPSIRSKDKHAKSIKRERVEESIDHERLVPETRDPTKEELLVMSLLKQQHEEMMQKTRPGTSILEKSTDVQSEIAAAREDTDQINRAIDSILTGTTETVGTSARTTGLIKIKNEKNSTKKTDSNSDSSESVYHSNTTSKTKQVAGNVKKEKDTSMRYEVFNMVGEQLPSEILEEQEVQEEVITDNFEHEIVSEEVVSQQEIVPHEVVTQETISQEDMLLQEEIVTEEVTMDTDQAVVAEDGMDVSDAEVQETFPEPIVGVQPGTIIEDVYSEEAEYPVQDEAISVKQERAMADSAEGITLFNETTSANSRIITSDGQVLKGKKQIILQGPGGRHYLVEVLESVDAQDEEEMMEEEM